MRKFIVFFAAMLAITLLVLTSYNDTEYIVTVTEKERVVNGDSSEYLVFTESEQGEVIVFKNTDNILRGKWDSSNIQGELKVGNTYKLTVVGYRIPILSMYQNIIECENTSKVER